MHRIHVFSFAFPFPSPRPTLFLSLFIGKFYARTLWNNSPWFSAANPYKILLQFLSMTLFKGIKIVIYPRILK